MSSKVSKETLFESVHAVLQVIEFFSFSSGQLKVCVLNTTVLL